MIEEPRKINGSVTRVTGQMDERESMAAFIDGAKKAASAARELASACNDLEWSSTAEMLDGIRVNCVKLNNMRAMSRLETLMAANMKAKMFRAPE